MTRESHQDLLRKTLDEPPQSLVEMRKVYNGIKPSSVSEDWLKKLMDAKPMEFLKELRQAEKDYRAEQLAKATEATNGQTSSREPVDEGSQRALAVAEKWLVEYAVSGGDEIGEEESI